MSFTNILFEVHDRIGRLTVNRPKVLNALNPETLDEIGQVLCQVRTDPDVKVLVITGAGDKAFIAGADIAQFQDKNSLQARQFAEKGQEVFFALEALPIPVIACVNGFALGGGCELAMSCDFIYASETAKFGQPEINLGIIPGFGGTQRLSRLVGRAKAKELCMLGTPISAREALDIGLAARVFPAGELWDKTLETAGSLAGKGPVALRAIKQVVDRGVEVDLKSGCAFEVEAFATSFSSEDAREGVAAFLEKRKPDFKGSFER